MTNGGRVISRLLTVLAITSIAIYYTWNGRFASEPFYKIFKEIGSNDIVRNMTLDQLTAVSQSECSAPVTQFVYIKTHKTGSTTIWELVNKFLNDRPSLKTNSMLAAAAVGGYPGRFRFRFSGSQGVPDVVQGHLRFDAKEFARLMPPQTKYFTVIREPISLFQSVFNYYPQFAKYSMQCCAFPFEAVPQYKDATDFIVKWKSVPNKSQIPYYFRFKNYQSHDLGLDPMLEDKTEIYRHLTELEKSIDLVIIVEHLDESIVLLKELLCWDWEMVKYKSLNVRDYAKSDLSDPKSKKAFQEAYNLDIILYDFFNKTLWRKVEAYGRERMARDVKYLKSLRDESVEYKPFKNVNSQMQWEGINAGDKEAYVKILKAKIGLKEPLKTEVAKYMVENAGGCPR